MSTQNLKNTARSLAVGDKGPRAITGKPVADGIVMGTAVVIAALPDSLADGPDKDAATYTLADFRRAVRLTIEQLREFQQRIRQSFEP